LLRHCVPRNDGGMRPDILNPLFTEVEALK